MQDFDTLSLDDQIDYAEWQLALAKENLESLRRKKAELDAEEEAHIEAQYQEYVALENGRLTLESDAHDCRIRESYNVSN